MKANFLRMISALVATVAVSACDFSPAALSGKPNYYYKGFDPYGDSPTTQLSIDYPECGTRAYLAPTTSVYTADPNFIGFESIAVSADHQYLTIKTAPFKLNGSSTYPSMTLEYWDFGNLELLRFSCNVSDGVGLMVSCVPHELCKQYTPGVLTCSPFGKTYQIAEISSSTAARAYIPSYISASYSSGGGVNSYGVFDDHPVYSSLRDQNDKCVDSLTNEFMIADVKLPILSISSGSGQ